ncbi:MAG: hypothetical protein HKL95_01980 [Phycisphaerae bacterium]|nr:hypothetical protein [Phycisphaerae bacterium]
MEKAELIKSILKFNVSTTADFLERFSESDLQAYLDRVSLVGMPAIALRFSKSPARPPGMQYSGKIRRLIGRLTGSSRSHWIQGLTARRVPS